MSDNSNVSLVLKDYEFGGSDERCNEEVETVEKDDTQENIDEKLLKSQTEEGSNEGEDEAEQSHPQLPEGFYEVECVQKKRVRKGQVQYYIKWLGWPETANTWEPIENLALCYDMVEEFEERLEEEKYISSHERKYRGGNPVPQPKKKQKLHNTFVVATAGKAHSTHVGDAAAQSVATVVQGSKSLRNRRRKPAFVKRFNPEESRCEIIYSEQDVTTTNTRSCNVSDITDEVSFAKIIRPIKFVPCGREYDLIFLVMRSNGQVVIADYKYLKATYPVMLRKYYEQHLSYII